MLELILKTYKPKEDYKPSKEEFEKLMYCNTICYDERYK